MLFACLLLSHAATTEPWINLEALFYPAKIYGFQSSSSETILSVILNSIFKVIS